MCGRVYIDTTLTGLLSAFGFAQPQGDAQRLDNALPRWNGAPQQEYPIIIRDRSLEPEVQGPIFVAAKWGLVPPWSKDGKGDGRPPPINARCETVRTNGLFRRAYQHRRCLVPVKGFFEWKDIYGTGKNKQPYAIAMKSGEPFAFAGLWDSWRDPETGLERKTFTIITCTPNEMVAQIHDRMPVILHPEDYERWLSFEPDPFDLLEPFPAELMRMWPIDRKVGRPANNTPDILNEVEVEESGEE